jgi:uncharacterized protein (UPF0335 family)
MAELTDNRLLLLVERIERLLEERNGITGDIRDVYAEAKAVGYDTKMIRKLIARRAMNPDDRREADMVLETYEAALGMDGEDADAALARLRPDASAIALAMLTEQVAGIDDPEQAALLIDHVMTLLDLRAEIKLLREQESARKKLAKAEGFDAPQISVTVRWFEKCAKHGEPAMRAAEGTFHLYRSTVDSLRPNASLLEGGAARHTVTADPKLGAMFAPAPAKPKKISSTVERLRADAAATRKALGGNL